MNEYENARRAWTSRYQDRPQTWALSAADTMARAGLLEFLEIPPRLGVEGAAYLPATAKAGTGTEPVLIVAARGGSELVRGWASEVQMLDWAGGRTTVATDVPLAGPPAPVMSRGWREDTVLATMLRHPGEIDVARQLLPPETYTTDVRYDTYAAMLALSARRETYLLGDVNEEVGRRLGHVPEDGMTYYGGGQAPLVGRYLARLARTRVSHSQFVDAVTALHVEDRRVRESAAISVHAPGQVVAAGAPDTLEAPPGPEPGGPVGRAGPVQGR